METKTQQQLFGLFLILEDAIKSDNFVSREYVQEKLLMLARHGKVNMHPTIKQKTESDEALQRWLNGELN